MARTAAPQGKTNMSSAIAAVALSAFVTGAGSSGSPAQAAIAPEERTGMVRTYHIPPSPMTGALNALADQNGLHLSYDARMTRGMRTGGLSGHYSVRDALEKLLAGTGLTYRLSASGNAVLIMLAQNDTGTQTDASGATLPTVEVTANAEGEQPGSSQGGAGLGGRFTGYTVDFSTPSMATKDNIPILQTPANVQVVPRQVLDDQQDISVRDAIVGYVSSVQPPSTTPD